MLPMPRLPPVRGPPSAQWGGGGGGTPLQQRNQHLVIFTF